MQTISAINVGSNEIRMALGRVSILCALLCRADAIQVNHTNRILKEKLEKTKLCWPCV
jgi:hypothetical protein